MGEEEKAEITNDNEVSVSDGGQSGNQKAKNRRKRTVRSFPPLTFEEALLIPSAIHQYAAGQKVRRITLFDHLKRSPEGNASRKLVTCSSQYHLTVGGYTADFLELTPEGRNATSPEIPRPQQIQEQFNLAIERIGPFKVLYDQFKSNKLPTQAVLKDTLIEKGYEEKEVAEAVDIFIMNSKFLGILKTVAGAERLLTIEHVIEEYCRSPEPSHALAVIDKDRVIELKGGHYWDSLCFYISPIGDPDSEPRKHSDLFLESIVEPALKEFNLNIVRADQISEAGMITRQVIEHLVNSKLVIADLSFQNPNVFYELAIRHACRKPIVQIIRTSDKIPFDIDQFRTIKIDTSSIYTLVPQLEIYRSEIANQVRRSLDDVDSVDNPISLFFPALRISFD